MQSVTNGQLGKVNQILSYDFVEEMPALVATETVTRLKEVLPTTPLLHQCVTALTRGATATSPASTAAAGANAEAYNTAMITALAARRLEVAKYLITFNRPALELSTENSSGLSVLHYAVLNGDLKIAQLVIYSLRLENEDRKGNLNINSRCHKQGWAPLHYAVDKLDVEAIRLLTQNGANLQATVATDKRQTPMELAKQKLKTANNAGKAAVQAAIDELQSAIERNKALKEAEAKSKKHADTAEAPKSAAPAAAVVAGTKEKKGAQPTSTPAAAVVAESSDAVAAKADKKKKKKEKEKLATAPQPAASAPVPAALVPPAPPVMKPAAAIVAPPAAPAIIKGKSPASEPHAAPAAVPASASAAPALASKNKKGKAAKAAAQAATATAEPSINAIAEMSVSSRDELVDRLLAMGFREADCLQAIALYGTDTDRAISWLCEKPVTASPSVPPATASAAKHVSEGDARGAEPTAAAAVSSTSSASTATNNTVAASASAGLNSTQKLQKEKDELRRINQAWNQKAIEEKRKVHYSAQYTLLFLITRLNSMLCTCRWKP
jgi:predicted NUDIX family NTP pyrophosphohydrolase